MPVLRVALFLLVGVVGLMSGCGNSIGDSCGSRLDCDPEGGRLCDITSPDGYCTILGCDETSCPEEAVCASFYAGDYANAPCVQATEDITTDDCAPAEACTVTGFCAPRTSEVRYCMLRCGDNSDCRDGYECRDGMLQQLHGGQAVTSDGSQPYFCAVAP